MVSQVVEMAINLKIWGQIATIIIILLRNWSAGLLRAHSAIH